MAEPFDEAAQQARRLLLPLHRDLIELLKHLVRTNSVNSPPDGNEAAAQSVLDEYYRAKAIEPDRYPIEFLRQSGHPYVRAERVLRNRDNLAVRLNGTGRGRSLVLNGHIDTVPPGRGDWSASPWSGCLQGSRLYGLGSFDMKAGVASHAAVMVALKVARIRLQGDILAESV